MLLRIQVIKVYELEVPKANEDDPKGWAYSLTSEEIDEGGALEDITVDYAEVVDDTPAEAGETNE